jgi:hypothetical protein
LAAIEPAQFKQIARALGTFQNVQIPGIGEIELFRISRPYFKCSAVEAAGTVGIRVLFEDMLPELLKQERIVVIVL